MEKNIIFGIIAIGMIKKNIKIMTLRDKDDALAYWLSKPSNERIEAVEILRRQFIGSTERFQRTIRIIQQAQG